MMEEWIINQVIWNNYLPQTIMDEIQKQQQLQFD